jgi:predicted phage tail protein
VELARIGLALLVVSTIGGTVLLVLWARAARDKERKVDAGAQAAHAGLALVAIACFWGYTAGANEMGGMRPFVIVLLAGLLLAGVLQLKAYRDAHREDEYGQRYAESSVPLMHVAGHVLIGLVAIAVVVVAAVQG